MLKSLIILGILAMAAMPFILMFISSTGKDDERRSSNHDQQR